MTQMNRYCVFRGNDRFQGSVSAKRNVGKMSAMSSANKTSGFIKFSKQVWLEGYTQKNNRSHSVLGFLVLNFLQRDNYTFRTVSILLTVASNDFDEMKIPNDYVTASESKLQFVSAQGTSELSPDKLLSLVLIQIDIVVFSNYSRTENKLFFLVVVCFSNAEYFCSLV